MRHTNTETQSDLTSTNTVNATGHGNGTTSPVGEPQSAEAGEFNLENYRYILASSGPGERRQLSIPVGRPKQFFKLDCRPEYRQDVAVYEHKEGFEPEVFLVGPAVQFVLGERKVKRAQLRVVIQRPHVLRLWAMPYPDGEGRSNTWRETMWEVAGMAESQWVMFELNESGTGWDAVVAATQWPDPAWPEEPLTALIQKGFKGRYIESENHVILQKLRGEI